MDGERMVERANAVTVTSDDLVRVVEETDHADAGPEFVIPVIVCLFSTDINKVVAVLCRILALGRLIGGDGLPGWVSRDDAAHEVFADEIVFEVAATQPLIEVGNELIFDVEEFRARVLELSVPITTA